MRGKFYALVVGVPGPGLQPLVRAKFPTVRSHPTGLKKMPNDLNIPSLSETVAIEY